MACQWFINGLLTKLDRANYMPKEQTITNQKLNRNQKKEITFLSHFSPQ